MPQRDEPLLGAVVQVALDAPAFALRAGGDACARPAFAAGSRGGLDRQPLVVQRHVGHRGAGIEQRAVGVERLVVDEHRDQVAVVVDVRGAAPCVR